MDIRRKSYLGRNGVIKAIVDAGPYFEQRLTFVANYTGDIFGNEKN